MNRDLRATGLLSAAIMGSRILGLAREVVFAALFGARAVADAYLVAFRIPNLLRDLLAEGALSTAFVPTFAEALKRGGRPEAERLSHLVLTAIAIITGTLVVFGLIWTAPIVDLMAEGFGGDTQKFALTVRLTRIMMPILALVSLGAVWMGILNAQRRFVATALAPALFNVVSILTAVAVLWRGGTAEQGIEVWAIGTLLAGVAQSGIQWAALLRDGYRARLRFRGLFSHPGVRRIAGMMAPATLGVAALQIGVFVNTRFAATLGDGAVAQLSYAFRLFALPLGMFGVALATVATTSVSEAAAADARDELARRCDESVQSSWMLTLPSAVGLCLLAEPIVTVVYHYGATSSADVSAIASCLQAYALGLAPYSMVKILAPAYYSVDRPRIPLVASVFGVAVGIGFNAWTHRMLGPSGIALGTGLGVVVNFMILRLAFARAIASWPAIDHGRRILALVAANAALGLVCWVGAWIQERTRETTSIDSALASSILLAVWLGVVITVAFVVYVAVLRWAKYPPAVELASVPRRLWARVRRRRSPSS